MKTVILIFTMSISLALQACPPGSFTCDDQTTCIEADKVCNGKRDCPWGDTSDEAASLCNDCNMQNLVKCPGEYCGRSCDGKFDCPWPDKPDENATLCNDCNSDDNSLPWPELTKCKGQPWAWEWEYCAKSCDGKNDCGDRSDEEAEMCHNCEDISLEKCLDGKSCIGMLYGKCDGEDDCEDLSDELATRCNNCSQGRLFRCVENGIDRCQPGWKKCNGRAQCDDYVDESLALCDNCTRPGMQMCENGKSCFSEANKCDGIKDCSDSSDEWHQHCQDCEADNLFRCIFEGLDRCMSMDQYWCNGAANCDNYEDEKVEECGEKDLFKCKDDTFVIMNAWKCDNFAQCLDLSDEANCTSSNTRDNCFQCRGTEMCIPSEKLCDGLDNCPDRSDEAFETCSQNTRLDTWKCDDGKFFVRKKDLCTGQIACDDGSDEKDDHCNCGLDNMWRCANGESCIRQELVCDGFAQCRDHSDEKNCDGHCYWRYPAMLDPFRKSCKVGVPKNHINNSSLCLSTSVFCDTIEDCDDRSDEENCSFFVYFNVEYSFILAVCVYWVIFFTYLALDTFIEKAKLNEKPENSVQISKFLCLIPWHKVSTQFIVASKQFEIIVFNKSPTFILQFFEILEFDCIHPKQKYELLLLMKNYMENNFGFYDDSFYKFLSSKIGPSSLTSSLLDARTPPSSLELLTYNLSLQMKKLPLTAVNFLSFMQSYIKTCFFVWDVLKDAIFFLIIQYHYYQGEEKSKAELLFLNVILSSFIISHLCLGFYAFYNRACFVNVSFQSCFVKWIFNFLLFLLCPLLPIFMNFKIFFLRKKMSELCNNYKASKITLADCMIEKNKVDNEIQKLLLVQSELMIIDATLESIPQFIFVVNFLSFSFLNFYTNRGRYLYFYSIANSILNPKNQKQVFLFTVGVLTSFFSATIKYVSFSNLLEKRAFMLKQKCLLFLYFLLTIFARTYSCFISITMPAIDLNHFLQDPLNKEKRDLTNHLSDEIYRINFNINRERTLNSVSNAIYVNVCIVGCLILVHTCLVLTHALIFLPAFRQSSTKTKIILLIANVFVCVPFNDNWSKYERQQTIFLRFLHFAENISTFYMCLYFSTKLPRISEYQFHLLAPVVVSHSLAAVIIYYFNHKMHPMAETWRSAHKFPSDLPSYQEHEVELYVSNATEYPEPA